MRSYRHVAVALVLVLGFVGLLAVEVSAVDGELTVTDAAGSPEIVLPLEADATAGTFALRLVNQSAADIPAVTITVPTLTEEGAATAVTGATFKFSDPANPEAAAVSVPANDRIAIQLDVSGLPGSGAFAGTLETSYPVGEGDAAEQATNTFEFTMTREPATPAVTIHGASNEKVLAFSTTVESAAFNLDFVEGGIAEANLTLVLGALSRSDGVDGSAGAMADIDPKSVVVPKGGTTPATLTATLPDVTPDGQPGYRALLTVAYGDDTRDLYTVEISRKAVVDLTVVSATDGGAVALSASGAALSRTVTIGNPEGNPDLDAVAVEVIGLGRDAGGELAPAAMLTASPASVPLASGDFAEVVLTGKDLDATGYTAQLVLRYLDHEQRIPLTVAQAAKPAFATVGPIAVNGRVGETIERTIQLRETGDQADVRGVAVDLGSGDVDAGPADKGGDVGEVIPGGNVTFVAPPARCPDHEDDDDDDPAPGAVPDEPAAFDVGVVGAGSSQDVKLCVDLDGVGPGLYTGMILVTSDNADAATVNVDVSVKRGPFLAALVLFAGILLAVVLMRYVNRLQGRDRVAARIEDLRENARAVTDPAFQPFGKDIESKLARAETALAAGTDQGVTDATTRVNEAWAVWDKWLHGVAAYGTAFAEAGKLIAVLQHNPPTDLRRTLLNHLRDFVGAGIATAKDADEARADVRRVETAWEKYCSAREDLAEAWDTWVCFEPLPAAARTAVRDALRGVDRGLGRGTFEIDANVATEIDLKPVNDELANGESAVAAANAARDAAQDDNNRYAALTMLLDADPAVPDGHDQRWARFDGLVGAAREGLEHWDRLAFASSADLVECVWRARECDRLLVVRAERVIVGMPDGEAKTAAQAELRQLLSFLDQPDNYRNKNPEAFRTSLTQLELPVLARVKAADPGFAFDAPPPSPGPFTGWHPDVAKPPLPCPDRPQGCEGVPTGFLEDPDGSPPKESRWPAFLSSIADRSRRLAAMFTTPKGRLRLYNMTAFMLALALLWWVAWEAEYAGVATFGDGGDYLKLFAWGAIGATTRDAAVKWVKALGVAELTGST